MKHIVHINRHHLAANRKDGGSRPIYSVRQGRRGAPIYGRAVILKGIVTFADPSVVTPLPCGATVWAECEGDVEIVDPAPFAAVKSMSAAA